MDDDTLDFSTGSDFDLYMNRLIHSWLKIVTLIAFILVPLFIILDYFTAPSELFTRFVAYRLVTTIIIVVEHLIIRFTQPSGKSFIHGYMVTFFVGLMITLMTLDLGGFNSSYYAGLNLVIIAINLFLTWNPVHSGINSILIVCMYVLTNSMWGGDFDYLNLTNNLYFLLSTVAITVTISYVRYNNFKKEASLRMKLESAQVNEIKALSEVAQIVASGDLSITVEKKSSDVAGVLEAAFDTMIQDLRYTMMHITDVVTSLSQYSNDIKISSDAIASGAKDQLDQTTESSNIIKEMTSTIITNAGKAHETNTMADRAIKTADQSRQYVDEAVEGMSKIARVVNNSAEKVLSLSKSSERINEIVQVINDIADQTNLLALNAAIESARAGEYGKGFAVVSDEVGKLAEKTGEATKEITAMIQNVLSDITETVTSIEIANREVESSIALVKKMHTAMNEIIDLSTKLRSMLSSITEDSKEQATAAEKINNNISTINEISRDLTGSLDTIVITVTDIKSLTENLGNMVQKFKLD
jgi:methyl-accepting chemotaxis protein